MSGDPPNLDMDAIVERVGLDAADVIDLMRMFFAQAPSQLDKIRNGISPGGDLNDARRNAHTIKGTAATLGLDELAELGRVVELAARENRLDNLGADSDKLADGITAWQRAFEAVAPPPDADGT